MFHCVSYSRETIFVAVSERSSSSLGSVPVTVGFMLTDLTVSCDPVVESDGSSSSILINVSGGSTASSVSSVPIANNLGPVKISSQSSSGVSGVGGGEDARPDPATQW